MLFHLWNHFLSFISMEKWIKKFGVAGFFLPTIYATVFRNQNIFFSLWIVYSFWSNVYNKYQNLSGHAVSQLLKFLTHNLCGYWSRVGSRVKKVIISNLVISLVPYLLTDISTARQKSPEKMDSVKFSVKRT